MDRKSAFYKFLLCGTVLWGLQGFSSSATGSSSFPFEECSSSNLRLNSIKNPSARQLIQETLSLITVRDSAGLDDLYYEPSWDVCSGLYTRITTKEATCLNIFKLYNQASKELMALEGPVHIISMLDHAAWMLLTGCWGISTDPTPRETLEELQTMSKELITRRVSYGEGQGIENFKNILKHSQKNSSNLAHLDILKSYIESIVFSFQSKQNNQTPISLLFEPERRNLNLKERRNLRAVVQTLKVDNFVCHPNGRQKSTLSSVTSLMTYESLMEDRRYKSLKNTNTESDVYINGFDTPVPTPRITPLTSTFTTSRSTSVSHTQVRPVLVTPSSTLVTPGSSAAIKFDPNPPKRKEGASKQTVLNSDSIILSSWPFSPALPFSEPFQAVKTPVVPLVTTAPSAPLSPKLETGSTVIHPAGDSGKTNPIQNVTTSPASLRAPDGFVASAPPVITTTSHRTTAPADLLSSIRDHKKDSSTVTAASSPSLGASGSSVVSPQPVASPPLTIPRPPLSLLNAIKSFSKKTDGNSSSLEPVMMDPASNSSVASPPPPPGPPALSSISSGNHTERRGSLFADLLAYKKGLSVVNGDLSSGSTANQNGVKLTDSKASSHQRRRSSKVDFENFLAQGLKQVASGLNGDKDGKDGEEEDDDDFKVEEAKKVKDVKTPLDKPIAARSDVVEKNQQKFAKKLSGDSGTFDLLKSIKDFSFRNEKNKNDDVIEGVRIKSGTFFNPSKASVGQTSKSLLEATIQSCQLKSLQDFVRNKQYQIEMQEEDENDDWDDEPKGVVIQPSVPITFDEKAEAPAVIIRLSSENHILYLAPFDIEDGVWPYDLETDEIGSTTVVNILNFKNDLKKYEDLFLNKKEALQKKKASLIFELKFSHKLYDKRGSIKEKFSDDLSDVEEILSEWQEKGIYNITGLDEIWDCLSDSTSEGDGVFVEELKDCF